MLYLLICILFLLCVCVFAFLVRSSKQQSRPITSWLSVRGRHLRPTDDHHMPDTPSAYRPSKTMHPAINESLKEDQWLIYTTLLDRHLHPELDHTRKCLYSSSLSSLLFLPVYREKGAHNSPFIYGMGGREGGGRGGKVEEGV